MKSPAEILVEYGPFSGIEAVHGVTFDGRQVWLAVGDRLVALDPATGATGRAIAVPANAGTAFDGRHLYQIAGDRIQKIEPDSGRVVDLIPAPEGADNSGLAWAEGALWIGKNRGRKIHRIDPQTGDVLATLDSNRFVTGVTWVEGELWHGTWEEGDSELRRVDPQSGAVLAQLQLPRETGVAGLEADGGDRFFCGGGASGKLRIIRRPR